MKIRKQYPNINLSNRISIHVLLFCHALLSQVSSIEAWKDNKKIESEEEKQNETQ
jgi:hypothetical protein